MVVVDMMMSSLVDKILQTYEELRPIPVFGMGHKEAEIHTSLLFCKYVSDAQAKDIEKNVIKPDSEYSSEVVGIFYLEVSIVELFGKFQKCDKRGTDLILSKLLKHRSIKINEIPLAWAVYSVLHEYGHWVDWENSRKTRKEIYLERKEEYKIADSGIKPYEELQSEQNADTFAMKRFECCMQTVLSGLSIM